MRSLIFLTILAIFSAYSCLPTHAGYTPVLTASPENNCDAFATIARGVAIQLKPAMRHFLKNIAIELRKDWHKSDTPDQSTKLLATYSTTSDEPWHFYRAPYNNSSDEVQLAALKLVKARLQFIKPPSNESFAIVFVFDSFSRPANSHQKRISKNAKPDIDFGPYMALLQRTVKSNWTLDENPGKNAETVLQFNIKKDGSITRLKITSHSGSTNYDLEALEAIKKLSPFLPPPGSETISIQYTFEYEPEPKARINKGKLFSVILEHGEPITTDLVDLHTVIGNFKSGAVSSK